MKRTSLTLSNLLILFAGGCDKNEEVQIKEYKSVSECELREVQKCQQVSCEELAKSFCETSGEHYSRAVNESIKSQEELELTILMEEQKMQEEAVSWCLEIESLTQEEQIEAMYKRYPKNRQFIPKLIPPKAKKTQAEEIVLNGICQASGVEFEFEDKW